MDIKPEECRKFNKEVRDWKSGGYKKVPIRCQKPLDCDYCGGIEIDKYKTPIVQYINSGQAVYAAIVTRTDWDAVRRSLHRSECGGYTKLPIDRDTYLLITPEKIQNNVKQVDVFDLDDAILQIHRINQVKGKIRPRRWATGIFSDKKHQKVGEVEVIWPEPVFFDPKWGEKVSNNKIASIVKNFLQYLSPLTNVTLDNANFYLDYRSRLKAALILEVQPRYQLLGFNESTKKLTEKDIEDWNIIPLSEPENANLTNNPTGRKLTDMIFFGKVPAFSEYPRDVPTWTDYKSEDDRVFEELVGGA